MYFVGLIALLMVTAWVFVIIKLRRTRARVYAELVKGGPGDSIGIKDRLNDHSGAVTYVLHDMAAEGVLHRHIGPNGHVTYDIG